ncbi:hypothetical protein J2Y45_003817 [Dyadobacter sp. BE34]|uniref:Uncharacterized protein n=1 Tax=Dyadobacter fermentans TaxID=94254 RepID=A0ABU1QZS7_9BACT|nr:hypothetical protein [Dyadobacter fermentans]MDR7044367.1 hypothetical protein [Dyadobacter sp. BE242]MDR7198677.1 hypothetical protein [Dyadobacter sp. BE34]MDR7216639.1 hypothetical protein [Dyadobacter sp. BE31]MDR7263835.1 hypothetical protein [Dyadobacter sp. BE32]
MNSENYPICKTSSDEYQFFSDGRRGVFEMRIVFEQVGDDVYNLAFGMHYSEASTIANCSGTEIWIRYWQQWDSQ